MEEEEACGGIIDFLPTAFFTIELVDENGTNLIENNFYQEDLLELQLNGTQWNDGIRIQDNIITLYPAGSEGDNRYLIHLSETETDTLDYNFTYDKVKSRIDGILFCGDLVELNSASYNQTSVDIPKVSQSSQDSIPLIISITVVKSGN